jgi:hypothetical protein
MRGTRLEKEVEICDTNQANEHKCKFVLHIFWLFPAELAWSQVIK